jgi:hypothetical protein
VEVTNPESLEVNVSSIEATNEAGDRSLDETAVANVRSDGIDSAKTAISNSIRAYETELEGEVALLGHGQGAALQTAFGAVFAVIDDIFASLFSSLGEMLENRESTYKQQAEGEKENLESSANSTSA